MADVALTAVINQTVEIGAKLIAKASSRLYWLREDINWIEGRMRHFQSCLKDAEAKEAGSHEVANLLTDIRDLALDISDTLDTYLPEIEGHKRKGPLGFVKHAACILCYGTTANKFALEIEKLKKRAEDLEARREKCNLTPDMDHQGNEDAETWDRRRKFLVEEEDTTFVGRQESLEKLKTKLLNQNAECKMISVVGNGGVGKTTLVKKIFHKLQEEFEFSTILFVSNKPKVRDLLLEMAKKAGLGEDKMDENLEINLRLALAEKRCLIYLDDIWKTETWDDLKNALPLSSRNRSRIIITSRYASVGRYIARDESCLVELNPLDQENSWELFSKLMTSASEDANKSFTALGLEDIGRNIVQKCGGLPLAIVVVVGMLWQKIRTKHAWKEVLDNMGKSDENNFLKILSLSYKDLPVELRPYFLYFGLYPEDSEISLSELTGAWVAEKLIQVNEAQDPKDVVAAKLEKLIDRNLIEMSTRSLDGRIKSCRVHDLVLSLCVEVAKERRFFCTLHDISSNNSISRLRRLTIDSGNDIQSLSSGLIRAPKLRTLLLFGRRGPLVSIPDEIENLSCLTYLKLTGNYENLPSSIVHLKKLVTLDVEGAYLRYGIPRSILKMKFMKLLILNSNNTFQGNSNARNEVYLPNVETLGWIGGNILEASSLSKLSNLRELRLHGPTTEHIEVLSGAASILDKLQRLSLTLVPQGKRLNLSGYHNLVRLHVRGGRLVYDQMTVDEYPPNLIKLTFQNIHFRDDPMETLKKLPRLEILKLKRSHPSTSMDCSGSDSFPELQVLAIIFGPTHANCLIVDEIGMPKLHKFVCDDLVEEPHIPERLRNITMKIQHNKIRF